MQKVQEPPSFVDRVKGMAVKDLFQEFSISSGITALQIALHSILRPDQLEPAIQSYLFNWEKEARKKFKGKREILMSQLQDIADEEDVKRAQEKALYEVRDVIKKALQERPGFLTS